jgi:hypothetical protein
MNRIREIIPDVMFISGAAAIAYGAHQIHEPAGYIVAGVIMFVTGIRMAGRK